MLYFECIGVSVKHSSILCLLFLVFSGRNEREQSHFFQFNWKRETIKVTSTISGWGWGSCWYSKACFAFNEACTNPHFIKKTFLRSSTASTQSTYKRSPRYRCCSCSKKCLFILYFIYDQKTSGKLQRLFLSTKKSQKRYLKLLL